MDGIIVTGSGFPESYHETVGRLLTDPSVSYWLAGEVRSLARVDPVDALRDAETLATLQRQRLIELQPPVIVAEVIGCECGDPNVCRC